MSILNNLPHQVSIYRRIRTKAAGGDGVPLERLELVSSAVPCYIQSMGTSEMNQYQRRGISVNRKVFFVDDPQTTEGMVLVATFMFERALTADERQVFDVKTNADPDASVARQVVWRVACHATTSAKDVLADYTIG